MFGEAEMKYTVLPLGFNATIEPQENCICDLGSCKVTSEDESWKIFQGCWHSFHITCLDGSPFCPLCKEMLQKKIKELGKVAKDAIFNINETKDAMTTANKEAHTEPDADNCMETPASINLEDINEAVNNLSKKISHLHPAPQPAHQHMPVSVPQVPSQQPSDFHSNSQHPIHIVTAHNEQISSTKVQVRSSQQQQQQQHTPSIPTKYTGPPITKHDLPGITEWLLPSNICQTRITGITMASNACTIIASLCCRNFLIANLNIPADANVGTVATKYKQTIITGNMLYKSLRLPHNQPNLFVQEVLNKIKDLKLNIVQDMGFFNAEDMFETFHQLL